MLEVNFEVRLYLDYLKEKGNSNFISDKTSYDLNFDELFNHLDFTTSKVGQQYFYAKLHEIKLSPYSNEHEAITKRFIEDTNLASQTEKQLKKLSKNEAYNIISLFTKELPKASKLYLFLINIFRFFPFIFLVCLFLFQLNFCIYLLVISLLVNTIIHFLNKSVQISFEHSIPQLLLLVKCSKGLIGNSDFGSISRNVSLSVDSLQSISKASSLFKIDRVLMSDVAQLAWLIMELLKIATLTEPYLFHKAIRLIEGKQNEIEKLYCFVGEIDSLLTISKIRTSIAYYCLPFINDKNDKLSFTDLYHPLIEGCIANSLSIKDKSILLTGSNMSGKSTFIRTVGVNFQLAQNINTCFARQFGIKQPLILQSMITVTDDLLNNKSLFFEEVLSVKEMLINSDSGQNLFLLDEIFKGTNTLERIAAAKAVLSKLVKDGNIVFVSTHDIELAELLESEFELYHFCEHIHNNEVKFDFLLKEGKLTAFNAIKILKMNGYSNEIIEEAYNTINQLKERYNTKSIKL